MKKIEDLTGRKFGRLTVISIGERAKNGKTQWYCSCECNPSEYVLIKSNNLKNGTESCGCIKIERLSKRNSTHGLADTLLYGVRGEIINRCTNIKCSGYPDYGGRGITIYNEWRDDFLSFYNWAMSNGYKKGLVIDRINNDGNYEPNNCQWILSEENEEAGKRRKFKTNTSGYVGVSLNEEFNKWISYINYKGIRYYLGSHTNINDAVMTRINKEIELFGEQRTNLNYKLED